MGYRERVKGMIFLMLIAGLIGFGLWSGVEPPTKGLPELSSDDKRFLLELARRQLESVIESGVGINVSPDDIPRNLKVNAACFVTLNENGMLRGCMLDSFTPHEPIYKNVMRNVILAATGDPRFPPVRPEEISKIEIEISILDRPRLLSFSGPQDLLKKLKPGRDGVILRTPTGTSTYLPQVWEVFPNPADFLSSLCEKQGARPDCWKSDPPPEVEIYRVVHFSEEELRDGG